jgi:hypothetical protein
MAVFLGATFFSLFLMHTWASLPTDYCVHCFSAYQTFYTTAGFFFILVVFSNGFDVSSWRLPALLITLLVFAAGLGLFYYQNWAPWLLENVQIPRLNRLLRQGEVSTVSLGDILTHTFNLPLEFQRRIAPAAGGLVLGLLLVVLSWAFYRSFLRAKWAGQYSFANVVLSLALLAGTVFPAALEDRAGEAACRNNFLAYYEEAANSLADLIPPGSTVYWRGSGRHLAFMLYMDDVKLFLPQIHGGGGYLAGDTQELLRFGLYNEELDKQWRQSADILIFWPTYVTKETRDFLDQPGYEQIPYDMGKLAQCEDVLLVYRRTS